LVTLRDTVTAPSPVVAAPAEAIGGGAAGPLALNVGVFVRAPLKSVSLLIAVEGSGHLKSLNRVVGLSWPQAHKKIAAKMRTHILNVIAGHGLDLNIPVKMN
jgi:hypothetical protein